MSRGFVNLLSRINCFSSAVIISKGGKSIIKYIYIYNLIEKWNKNHNNQPGNLLKSSWVNPTVCVLRVQHVPGCELPCHKCQTVTFFSLNFLKNMQFSAKSVLQTPVAWTGCSFSSRRFKKKINKNKKTYLKWKHFFKQPHTNQRLASLRTGASCIMNVHVHLCALMGWF